MGTATVSGLTRADAQALDDSLENARTHWWRRALAPQLGRIRSTHDCLKQLADPPNYVRIADLRDLTRDAQAAAAGLAGQWPPSLSDTPEIQMLKDILDFLKAPDRAREKANKAHITNELTRSRTLFDTIEAMPLTEEQRHAVILDDHRNLVVAAAGSGKTSVIVAKAGWLIQRGYRRPSELLLLAFARDARHEMQQRIRKRLGPAAARGVTVRTFHSLGLSIIGQAEGKRPALAPSAESDGALFELLKNIVADLLADGGLSGTLLEWFRDQFAPYKSEHEFRNWGEYWNYIRRHDIRSLKGEKVKSYEECEIANYLYLNGIAYEYEASYEHNTATPEKRQYLPDFHLPDHGIYIEHFGLDAEGRTAPFVDNDKYHREMDWKRWVHEGRGTVLIETFSHEHADGNLLRNLAKKLGDHGVALSPIPRDDLFGVLEQQGRIDPLTRLLATFLQHFKGARLSFEEVSRRAVSLADRKRAEAFLAVFRPVFERYQETLTRAGTIDFHDMINRATDLVESGRYRSPFGYIMVDEFQDISPARARLLKALLDSAPDAQLFAVGDDWQAIYRFGGSDIAVMREFETWFGDYLRIDLETMFRTDDRIAKVATDFVLRNPAQIRKNVRPMRKAGRPAVHLGLPEQKGPSLLMEALGRIDEERHRQRTAAGPVPAPEAPEHGPPGTAISGAALCLQDRAPLEGHGGRLRRGARPVFRQTRLPLRDHRRSAAQPGAGGARSALECRRAAPALRRHYPGTAPGLPAGRRRTAVIVRPGTDARPIRRERIRPAPASRRALSAVQGRTPGTPQKSKERKYLLRLLQLPVLQPHPTAVSKLRGWADGKDGGRSSLPGLR